MPDDFYPDLRCWHAPLRNAGEHAPKDGCDCPVCSVLRLNNERPTGPIRPGTPEWDALLALTRD